MKPLESVSAKPLESNSVSATLSHLLCDTVDVSLRSTSFEFVWSAEAFDAAWQVAACMQCTD